MLAQSSSRRDVRLTSVLASIDDMGSAAGFLDPANLV
jgi:hypothetical protein